MCSRCFTGGARGAIRACLAGGIVMLIGLGLTPTHVAPCPGGVAAGGSQSPVDWAEKYRVLKARIDSRMDEPRGYPSELGEYLKWLDAKAADRAEVKEAYRDAMDVVRGNPEWAAKFDKLLAQAQQSGENTVWDACFKFLRAKKDYNWQNALSVVQNSGRPLYTKAAETSFDPVFVKEEWVRCLMRFAITNVEEDPIGLYSGRLKVFGEFGEDGLMIIPKRDFDVQCERRINFQVQDKGEPLRPTEEGLEIVDRIRKECEWWGFGREQADAVNLMIQFYKDTLCFNPKARYGESTQSHQSYRDIAQRFNLPEAVAYNEGFYGTVKGHVYRGAGKDRTPARGAKVEIRDPKDGRTWTAKTDNDGAFEIKRAPLHQFTDSKGRHRCPKFELSAELGDCRGDTTYEGPLAAPDPAKVFEKDLVISCRWTVTVELRFTTPFVPEIGRMSIADLAMRVVFNDVGFESWPADDPLGGCCAVDNDGGRGTFTRFELNDTLDEAGAHRRPRLIKGPPKEFDATLMVSADAAAAQRPGAVKAPGVAPQPPERVRMSFWTSMGLMAIHWGSTIGSATLEDFRLEFEVPWRDLLAGKPVTLNIPYAGDANETGAWTITFAPGPKN